MKSPLIKNLPLLPLIGRIFVGIAGLFLVLFVWLSLGSLPIPKLIEKIIVEKVINLSNVEAMALEKGSLTLDPSKFRPEIQFARTEIQLPQDGNKIEISDWKISFRFISVLNGSFYPSTVIGSEIALGTEGTISEPAVDNETSGLPNDMEPILQSISIFESAFLSELELIEFKKISVPNELLPGNEDLEIEGLVQLVTNESGIAGNYFYPDNSVEAKVKWNFSRQPDDLSYRLDLVGDTRVLSNLIQSGGYQPEFDDGIDYGTVLAEISTNQPYDRIAGSIYILDSSFETNWVATPFTINSLGMDFRYIPETGTINLDSINLRSNSVNTKGVGTINVRGLNEGLEVTGKVSLESFLTEQINDVGAMDQSGDVSFAILLPSETQKGRFNVEGVFTGLASEQRGESSLAYLFQENSKLIGKISGELGGARNIDSLRGQLSWINDPNPPGKDSKSSRINIPFRYEYQNNSIISNGLFISVEEFPFAIEGGIVMELANENTSPIYSGEFTLRDKAKSVPLPAPSGKLTFNGVTESEIQKVSYQFTFEEGLVSLLEGGSPSVISMGEIEIKTIPEEGIGFGGSLDMTIETDDRKNEFQLSFDGRLKQQEVYFNELEVHSKPISIFSSGRLVNLTGEDEDASPITGLFNIKKIEYQSLENRIPIGADEDLNFSITLGDEYVSSEISGPIKFLTALYSLQANEATGQFEQDHGEGNFTLKSSYNWLTSLIDGEFKGNSLVIPLNGEDNRLKIDNLDMVFSYPLNSEYNFISIDRLSAESDLFHVSATGNLYAEGSIFNSNLVGNLILEDGRLKQSQIFDTSLQDIRGNIDFKLDTEKKELRIAQAYIEEGGTQFWGDGVISFDNQEKLGSIHFWAKSLNKNEAIKFWPLNFVSKTRAWFQKNIHAGEINELTGGATLFRNTKPRIEATYSFSNVEFTYLKGFPPLVNGNGFATLTETDLSLQLEEGHTEVFKKGIVTLDGSRFYIPDITNNKIPSEVYLKLDSQIYPLFELLDLDPFNFIAKANMTPVFVSGAAKGEVKISFPLVQNIPQEEISYKGFGEFSEFETIGLFYGKIFQSNRLAIQFDDQKLVIEGNGNFGNLPVSATMNLNFEPGITERLGISGTFDLSEEFFEEFNIGFIPEIVSGSSQVNFNLDFPPDSPPIMALDSDLYGTSIEIPVIDWEKPSEVRGKLEIGARITSPLDINTFRLSAPGLGAEGKLNLTEDGGFESFNLTKVELEEFYSGELEISFSERGTVQLEIPGTIELGDSSMLAQYSSGDESDQVFSFYLGELKISPRLSITEINGFVQRDEDIRANFNGKMNGGATLNGWLFDRDGSWMFRIASDNAGQVARDAELIETLIGGKVWVDINPGEGISEFHGTIIISDITIPPFYELGASPGSESEERNEVAEGIKMDQIRSNFHLTKEKLVLNDAAGIGTQVGFSFSGDYSLQEKVMNFEGTVAPLRVITTLIKIVNPISLLVPRRISGEIGTFDFTLIGTLDDPDFSIEPTSVVNPSNLTGFLFLNIVP